MSKQHVALVVCGHVDAGKSTTTGRLLFELGGITERDIEKLKIEAERVNKSSFHYAFHMDNQKEERERGVTISCTTKQFFTPSKHYTVIDAPGHRDFIKNMITGASQADVALLMVPADGNFAAAIAKQDAKAGKVMGQTRQHSLLINLLGVKQLIVGINKMDCDTAQYSKERFEEVRDEVANMLVKVGWKSSFVSRNVVFLPISGYVGDNLVEKSSNMPWWNGTDVSTTSGKTLHVDTLLDALDAAVEVPPRLTEALLRVPISNICQIKGVGMVVTGRIEQGTLMPGDEVVFLPSHTAASPCAGKVFSLQMHHKPVDCAKPGDNVGIVVRFASRDLLPRAGDVMVPKADKSIGRVVSFTAQVQILGHPGELKVGYSPIGFVRTGRSAVKITAIEWKVGKETGGVKEKSPPYLKAGDVASVVFQPQKDFVVAPFSQCEGLGRIAILEGPTCVAMGKIVGVELA